MTTNEASEEVTEDTVFHNKLTEFNEKINEMVKQMKELQAYGKSLDKEFNAVSRQLMKLKKTKNKSSSRPLSGFAVPSRLTDELYEFLKIQKGTLIARKDVTKMMNEYIIEHNCRNEKDKRNIIPNEALQKLFNCGPDEQITYFNLQSYMKQHYLK
jgi:chromatin remodeling complex protein RSC6